MGCRFGILHPISPEAKGAGDIGGGGDVQIELKSQGSGTDAIHTEKIGFQNGKAFIQGQYKRHKEKIIPFAYYEQNYWHKGGE